MEVSHSSNRDRGHHNTMIVAQSVRGSSSSSKLLSRASLRRQLLKVQQGSSSGQSHSTLRWPIIQLGNSHNKTQGQWNTSTKIISGPQLSSSPVTRHPPKMSWVTKSSLSTPKFSHASPNSKTRPPPRKAKQFFCGSQPFKT